MEMSQRAHKPKCSVWQYWQSDVGPDGVNLVRCMFCSHEYMASAAKNATRLRQHIVRRCSRVPEAVRLSFPEEMDKMDDKSKEISKKSDQNSNLLKRKLPLRNRISTIDPEIYIKDESDDDISITSEVNKEKTNTKDTKTLEEENQRLSSKLKICLEQKEALLQINKYLDQSLTLMQKLNSFHKTCFDINDTKVEEITNQLNSSNNSVKEWKQKYNLIEFNQKMKGLYKTSVSSKRLTTKNDSTNIGKNHRPQSTIWKYFTNLNDKSQTFKRIQCKFCDREYRYKQLNATKCRTHIVENCENVPEHIRQEENNWIEYRPQSKVEIWRYFSVVEEGDKTTVECIYCGHIYSGKNATKCRSHLVGKCESVPDHIRETIANQCDSDFVNNSQITPKSKSSNIWRHFDIEKDEGRISCVCIYCRHFFSYKNATKSRRHLTDKCPAIPRDIRLEIASESEEHGRTWTQTKIPIWDYFTIKQIDGKEFVRCIYCGYTYGHKNATKLRIHLLSKCEDIPEDDRENIREQCEKSYLTGILSKSEVKFGLKEEKMRKLRIRKERDENCGAFVTKPKCFVWQYFKEMSEGNTVRFNCLYCNHSFNYRNATKMRQHLMNSCKEVPENVKDKVKELDTGVVRPYSKRIQSKTSIHECCWPGCDFKFTKLSRLKVHQLSHTGVVQRIRCDWPGCEWSGRTKSDVKIHRCIHTGEKPYVCDWPGCDFKTAKPSSLWIHKRRHKELFKFPCDWPGCERRFLTSWERHRHKNTHLGIKPYPCQYCDKRYPIAYKLKVHQNKHHLIQMLNKTPLPDQRVHS